MSDSSDDLIPLTNNNIIKMVVSFFSLIPKPHTFGYVSPVIMPLRAYHFINTWQVTPLGPYVLAGPPALRKPSLPQVSGVCQVKNLSSMAHHCATHNGTGITRLKVSYHNWVAFVKEFFGLFF
jgi:hypothetical protein